MLLSAVFFLMSVWLYRLQHVDVHPCELGPTGCCHGYLVLTPQEPYRFVGRCN